MHLQSFEPTCLRRLRDRTDLRLVQLVEASGAPADFRAAGEPATYDDLVSPRGLRVVSRYADAVGLAKIRLLGSRAAAEALVDHAHLSGLQVLAWTLREEPQFLAPGRGTPPVSSPPCSTPASTASSATTRTWRWPPGMPGGQHVQEGRSGLLVFERLERLSGSSSLLGRLDLLRLGVRRRACRPSRWPGSRTGGCR